MKLNELLAKLKQIEQENPKALDCDVMVDTEARCTEYHYYKIKQVYFEDYESFGISNMISIVLDI